MHGEQWHYFNVVDYALHPDFGYRAKPKIYVSG